MTWSVSATRRPTGVLKTFFMDNIMVNESRPRRNILIRIISFSWINKNIVVDIISFLFIVLFVYAAVSKLLDYHKFRVELGKSPMLIEFASPVSWAIPAIEIIISILLVVRKTRLYALYASFFLMTMFTAYIIAILNFSDYIPCSCGGVLQNMTWHQHLIFNVIFIFLGLIGILFQTKSSLN
jgi:uncharacterized membrane protein YphA (DoxX/SURF4 family)